MVNRGVFSEAWRRIKCGCCFLFIVSAIIGLLRSLFCICGFDSGPPPRFTDDEELTISRHPGDVSAKLSAAVLLSRLCPRSPREAYLSERSMQNKAPASISRARRYPPLPCLAHLRGKSFFSCSFRVPHPFFFPIPQVFTSPCDHSTCTPPNDYALI